MARLFRSLSMAFVALSGATAVARAQAPVATAAKGVTKSTPKPKATTPAPRIRAVAKTPFAGIESRGSNPTGPFAKLNEVQRDSIIENSRSLLGIKYKWAGATPERGVDCSGLVQYVFAKLGISV